MLKMPLQPPTRQDLMVFQGLQRAIVEKKAFIKIKFKHLNRFKSPFFNPWENILPLLTILLLSLVLMMTDGLIIGTATLLLFSVGYGFLMPYLLEPFMVNRVVKRIVPRIEKFLIAWRYGGISIVLTADTRYSCQSPLGDWKQFVEAYFPDLIPQDISEKETKTDAQ